jgi:hypothetical protein
LAFIHAYTRLKRRPPAEIDMQRYFQASPPSVHQMVLTPVREGFIRREPGVAQSIEMLIDPECPKPSYQCFAEAMWRREEELNRDHQSAIVAFA